MGYFSEFGRHLDLMRRMFRRTGVSNMDVFAAGVDDHVRQAIFRCRSCTKTDACAKWLDSAGQGDAPPDFCKNAAYIERLRALT
jgi:Family of unknown function (DUF6455)